MTPHTSNARQTAYRLVTGGILLVCTLTMLYLIAVKVFGGVH